MSGKINLHKWNESTDGPLSEENMEKKLKSMGYSSKQYVYQPGTIFPRHTHSQTTIDAITSGKFEMKMFDETLVMVPGDMVEVPKNAIHNSRVVGNEPVTFFDSSK